MTYCVAMNLDDGLVFVSDSRTNAGVDHVATFKKMRTFVREGDRVIVLLSSGNLSITQSVENSLQRAIEVGDPAHDLFQAETMYGVVGIVGAVLREVHARDAAFLAKHDTDFVAGFIVGGQIRGERPRLFQVYAAGNFIESTPDTPYFQIGETKYGKPIIDRLIRPDTDLMTAAKCALISFDSTMNSNVSVGLPIDLAIYRRDRLRLRRFLHIEDNDAYFDALRRGWSRGLDEVFGNLPSPRWDFDDDAASSPAATAASPNGLLTTSRTR